MNAEGQQRDPHARSPVQLTKEEIEVLKECRVTSVYYRGIPIGLLSLAVARGILQTGKFPRLTKWSGFFYTGLFGVGFLGGVASYREECTKKILALENSVLGNQLRDFMKEKGISVDNKSEFAIDEVESLAFPDFDRKPNNEKFPDIEESEPHTISRWDEIRQKSRQSAAEPSRGITFEDLRKRNRSNPNTVASNQKTDDVKKDNERGFVDIDSYSSQSFEERTLAKSGLDFSEKDVSLQDATPENEKPIGRRKTYSQATRRKNIYGDEMD